MNDEIKLYKDHNKGLEQMTPERRIRALKMRQSGMSYREIGRALNVSHVQAWKDVMSCIDELKEQCKEEAEKVKEIELERLDEALKAIWPSVLKGDLGAIDRLIRIQERRARFEGLDAPSRQEIETNIPEPIEFVLTPTDERD